MWLYTILQQARERPYWNYFRHASYKEAGVMVLRAEMLKLALWTMD